MSSEKAQDRFPRRGRLHVSKSGATKGDALGVTSTEQDARLRLLWDTTGVKNEGSRVARPLVEE
jgi:hypothetical protein